MTLSAEAAILHAIIEDDLDEARRRIAELLRGERRALLRQAWTLSNLLNEREQLLEIVHSRCRWYRNCAAPIIGYYTCYDSNYGVCATHAPAAREHGLTVHDLPQEVTL